MRPHFSILLLALSILIHACGSETTPPLAETQVQDPEGLKLMKQYCVACHALPSPGELDKKTWNNTVMVRMGAYLGVYWDTQKYYDTLPSRWLEPGEGGERVLNAGIYPPKPVISREDFQKIREWIVSQAPEKLTGPTGQYAVAPSTPRFKAIPVNGGQLQPLVTAVHINEATKQFYASYVQQNIVAYNAAGKIEGLTRDNLFPVHLNADDGLFSVVDIGSFTGIDNPKGTLTVAKSFEDYYNKRYSLRMEKLQRPVHVSWADLDGDNNEDMILCEFGNLLGTLAWYRNTGKGYDKNILLDSDGAVCAYPDDFNGDGKTDIIALMANADEGIDLYINEGAGKFARTRLFRFTPSHGSAAMELLDFDKDGDMDLLVANGDNADFKPVLKPNHGIRLYRNDGNLNFTEAFYLPLSGAYGTRTRDFDQDGDMDIAAVSFYPDYNHRMSDCFVYFENDGQNHFNASTFPGHNLSRWMILDAGDLDGDGDEDIVLGAFNVKSSDATEETYQSWMKNNIPVMILNNTTRP